MKFEPEHLAFGGVGFIYHVGAHMKALGILVWIWGQTPLPRESYYVKVGYNVTSIDVIHSTTQHFFPYLSSKSSSELDHLFYQRRFRQARQMEGVTRSSDRLIAHRI